MSSLFPTLRPGDPALLHQIHKAALSAAPAAPPLDQVILQALLTCLVAQDAHLIIRTTEEDVGPVARLVVWILSSVFDYSTHKLKIRPKLQSTSYLATHDYFLRSLFFPTSSSSSASQDEGSEPNKPRKAPSRRSRTLRASPISPIHMESTSLSNVSSKSPIGHHPKSSSPDSGLHHHSHVGINLHTGNTPSTKFPRAIVISGLENAAISSQRALAQVLAEKRISFDANRDGRNQQDGRHDSDPDAFKGTCNLPDGFILVYVCPADTRERPNLHNSLLDKFAMSCNITLKSHIRNALQPPPVSPIVRTNSGAYSSSSTALASSGTTPLPSPHIASPTARPPLHPRHTQSHSGSHLPTLSNAILPPGLLGSLREACTKTHLSPTLLLYLADLFSATRHHAQVDGTLLTARCVHDAEKLARAARVVGADPTGVELLRAEDSHDVDDLDRDEDDEDLQWQDDELEAAGTTGSLRKSTSPLKGRETPSDTRQTGPSAPVLDVTEVNIARIFPRCVSHRLRIRDGPREEVLAGAVFGATFGDSVAEETGTGEAYVDAYEVRPTVKDILVSVMSEV
ncbi:hypothetical protein D9756_007763 [Leucocoprinus leucothites]|uniref:Uncharacterized protein n=1 Tax=Leucocoprinus leucothites TaxID=201217 RepID=A0A8H5D290_9AGAR|nr:hypothetical protein D9756_007763 [Leucoagaricus leucothites]